MQMSSREFNQNTARAKREAALGPLTITERGTPAFVLLTAAEYNRLASRKKTLFEALYDPESAHIDLELPERRIEPMRDIDLSDD
jgi:prevent-host-death family protein